MESPTGALDVEMDRYAGDLHGDMDHTSESQAFLDHDNKQGPDSQSTILCSCLTVAYYQPFFDVDTADIKARLLNSVMVWKEQPFLSDESIKPDLYGPFWIATTLVFVLAVTSHVSSWMGFKGDNWEYDFQSVIRAASIIYTACLLLPLVMYAVAKRMGGKLTLIQLVSLYGYSLVPYLPAALLCLFPSDFISWIAILSACVFSSIFLIQNLRPHVEHMMGPSAATTLGVVGIVQVLFAFTVKLMFYWNS